jgi:hypothetical protein
VPFNNKSWEMLRALQPEARFNDADDGHFADIVAPIGGVGAAARVAPRSEGHRQLIDLISLRNGFLVRRLLASKGREVSRGHAEGQPGSTRVAYWRRTTRSRLFRYAKRPS